MGAVVQRSLLVAACTLLWATSGIAQSVQLSVGAGAAVPTGKLRDAEKSGWLGQVIITYGIGESPVGLRLDGVYTELTHKSGAVGKTKVGGVTGDLVVRVAGETMKPYLLASAGVYRVNADSGQATPLAVTRLALGRGGGLSFGIGSASLFIEGRFMTVATSGSHTKFFPLTAGLSVALW